MDNTSYKYTVAIECMTYNHSNYIIDALNGFVMQQTDFPYVAIVVDDASTDNEPEVILSFFEKEFDFTNSTREETDDYIRIVAKHKTNLHCIFVVILLKYNHYKIKTKRPYFKEWEESAKYIALCEGDDYWTNPLKLQKQVDFMDHHPDYSMCCHNVCLLIDNEIKQKDVPETIKNKDFTFTNKENLDFWMTETSSVLFRGELYRMLSLTQSKFTRDTHIVYYTLKLGKGFCFAFYGSVYRHHPAGIYSMTNSFDKQFNAYLIYKELSCLNQDDDIINTFFDKFTITFFNTLRQEAYKGNLTDSFRNAIRVYYNDIGKNNQQMSKIFFLWKIFKSYIVGEKKRAFSTFSQKNKCKK